MRTRTAEIDSLETAGCTSLERSGPVSTWELADTPLNRSADALTRSTSENLARAKAYRERLGEVSGPRTIENTLVPYNELVMHLDAAAAECHLFRQVHPDEGVREAGRLGEQQVAVYATELSLDRGLFEAFQAVEVSEEEADTRFFVEKRLRDFRRAGVDKPDEVRKRIAELNEELVRIGQEFSKNIVDDDGRRGIELSAVSDLDGLPADWVEKHRPDSDGRIRVGVRTPDYVPFMTYARNAQARQNLYRESRNKGFPKNLDVLGRLLARRHELARTLGYSHYADYVTEDKMIGSAAQAAAFIDRVSTLGSAAAKRDYSVLLKRKRNDFPDTEQVHDWEKSYYDQLVKAEQYAFDPQSVRPYFNFVSVQRGLFDLTQKLFGVRYRKIEGLDLWHDTVTAWDVEEGADCIGRFYLDLHPRENKHGHAAQFDFRTGVGGRRIPQAVLVCNFPNPRDSKDGSALMEHDEVVTFFHEFGHLLHSIFAGRQRWIGNAGISTEWDFVEAPSQMLEEWCFQYDSLKLFAKHYRTGEPIPRQLVENLRRASDFGKGLAARHQMFFASLSLNFYNRDPVGIDSTALVIELQNRYSAFGHEPETHFQCGFGHLDGYSAIYYTYMWSKVISKDLFSRFETDGIMNPIVAGHYRSAILDRGGSRKAVDLVHDFLGRAHCFDAFELWLNRT